MLIKPYQMVIAGIGFICAIITGVLVYINLISAF